MALTPVDDDELSEEEIEMLRKVFDLIEAERERPPRPEPFELWRLDAERDAAAVTVEPLLRQTPRERWAELTTHPALRTVGAVGRLIDLTRDALAGDPAYAHAVAQLAVAVAEEIPEDAYPFPSTVYQHRVQAWRELGSSFRALGRYDEAIRALETARSRGAEHGNLIYTIATADLILAGILQEMNRIEEARELLQKCREIFRTFGSTDLVAQCDNALQSPAKPRPRLVGTPPPSD